MPISHRRAPPDPADVLRRKSEFRSELENLINSHSMENESDTPDFILADYLLDSLAAFDKAVRCRHEWHASGAPKPEPR